MAGTGSVTVGLNTDEFTLRYKNRLPVVEFKDRRVVLEACRYVDRVLPNDQMDGSAVDVIEAVNPNVIVVGSDWQKKDYPGQLGVTWEWLNERDIEVRFVPYTDHISSSLIRAQL